MTFGGISMKYQKERESIRRSHLTLYAKKQEEKSLQEKKEESRKRERREKIGLVKSRISGVGKSVAKTFTERGKHTILSKPTAKVPSVSPTKFVSRTISNAPLVREGRTGFFKEEMMEETKWLS